LLEADKMNRYDKPVLRNFYGAGGSKKADACTRNSKRALSLQREKRLTHQDHVFFDQEPAKAPELDVLLYPSSSHTPPSISNIRKCKQIRRKRMSAYHNNQHESYF
jgi:hypothetical protein